MTKFPGKPMGFSKALLASAIGLSIAMGAQAQSISEGDRAMLREMESDANLEAIIEEMELEALRDSSQQNFERQGRAEMTLPGDMESRGTLEEQRQQAQEASKNFYREHEIIIFASQSLEREGLEDILEAASANPRIAVVFRGVPEGMKIDDGMRAIQELAVTFDPMPTIAIDPTMFDEHGVDAVPAIVVMEPSTQTPDATLPDLTTLLDENADLDAVLDDLNAITAGALEEERKVLARVEGLTEPMWIQRQLEDGKRGDFGNQGPVREIAEPHLIEVMQQKAQGIDWEAEQQGAVDRFWTQQSDTMFWKPAVTQAQTRRIDPTVTVVEAIRDAEGQVIVPEGAEFNPLDQMPFDIALVIFDGGDPGQVQVARDRGRELEAQKGVRQVMYLMTRFDTLQGWDGYTEITDALDRHVYLLTGDVEERFEIERVPSLVTADDTHFIVEEVVAPRISEPLSSQ